MTVSHADAEKSVGDSRMSGAWKLGEREEEETRNVNDASSPSLRHDSSRSREATSIDDSHV